MFRLYIERKNGFENEVNRIFGEIKGFLGVDGITGLRYLNRYDIENVSEETIKAASCRIFSEPQSDICYFDHIPLNENDTVIAWEYLPGQYDQRSDSAEQCLSLLTGGKPSNVRCAKMVILSGNISASEIEKIKNYLINPVDSRLASLEIPETLKMTMELPGDIPVFEGFTKLSESELADLRDKMGLAMDMADILFLQDYFKKEGRDPFETESRVLDTY